MTEGWQCQKLDLLAKGGDYKHRHSVKTAQQRPFSWSIAEPVAKNVNAHLPNLTKNQSNLTDFWSMPTPFQSPPSPY